LNYWINPNNAYTVTVAELLNSSYFNRKSKAIITLSPEQKMQPDLAAGIFCLGGKELGVR